jgi:hypothetical protein
VIVVHISIEPAQTVFWHRDLPPMDAEAIGEHIVEATSGHVSATISHRDELWDRCYRELMTNVNSRLSQEIARLGGHYAHVFDEFIDARRNDATGEAWLHGRFAYMLYRGTSGANVQGESRPSDRRQ